MMVPCPLFGWTQSYRGRLQISGTPAVAFAAPPPAESSVMEGWRDGARVPHTCMHAYKEIDVSEQLRNATPSYFVSKGFLWREVESADIWNTALQL